MMGTNVRHAFGSALMMSAFIFVTGCTHKVQIIPSDKPIIINLNVKIDQEIRVRLDKDVEDLLANNPDIF
jgi:hypothetical protein